MTPVEELDLLLTIIRKYDLPLSPILEYAVTEKKEANKFTGVLSEENHEDDCVLRLDGSSQTELITNSVVGFNIPENADTSTKNKYLMQFCYGILSDFEDALNDREKSICNSLLVENAKKKASEEYRITEERVRQIFVKSIKKICKAHKDAMQELDVLRKENEELSNRNYILEKELANASTLDEALSLQEKEDNICHNAKRLLACPIEYLPFSVRTKNILNVAQIEYFKDIPQLQIQTVLRFRNCGKKTITELRDFMSTYNLDFGMTYFDIVSRLAKFTNEDFDISFFAHRPYMRHIDGEDSSSEDIIDEDNTLEQKIDDAKNNDSIQNVEFFEEESSTLSICEKNRSGTPWTSEEEEAIANYYEEGHSFHNIAKAIGRSEVAVMSRLGQLGLINYTYGQEYYDDRRRT